MPTKIEQEMAQLRVRCRAEARLAGIWTLEHAYAPAYELYEQVHVIGLHHARLPSLAILVAKPPVRGIFCERRDVFHRDRFLTGIRPHVDFRSGVIDRRENEDLRSWSLTFLFADIPGSVGKRDFAPQWSALLRRTV